MASNSTESKEEKKDIMVDVAEKLASVRQTLEALDKLEDRWKEVQKEFGMKLSLALQITMGASLPSQLTLEQKEAVLGGKPTLGEICARLKDGHFRKVIVMAGAGISVSAGIPDFRSPVSGLYDSIDLAEHSLASPQAVFEIDHFRKDPRPFFSVVKQLLPGKFQPTLSHYFIKILADKELLHRCYTQNIDGLERLAGITEQYLVEAHGTLTRTECTECGRNQKIEEVRDVIMKNDIPKCLTCKNVIKPSIVFFGEELPSRFKFLHANDFEECDLLIVMGTSLKVLPFSSLINRVKDTTPRLLLNRERVGSFTLGAEGGYRDVAVLQDCDRSVREICDHCGWKDDLEALLSRSTKNSTAHVTNSKKSVPSNASPAPSSSVKPKSTKNSTARVANPKQPSASPTPTSSVKPKSTKNSTARVANPKQSSASPTPSSSVKPKSTTAAGKSSHSSSKQKAVQGKHTDHHH